MKASDLFVQCMEAEGVTYIFGVPGEENLDLLESLRKSSITLITTRNEQTAAFMAAAYGRLTGQPGVAISTLGPGATNLMTGVAYAQLGGMPLVVLTGQKPIKASKQGRFQVLDLVTMMRPVTKWATSIPNVARIPSTTRQAWKTAVSEKPGSVHIEFPEDIAREDCEVCDPYNAHYPRRPQVEDKALVQLVDMICATRTPMVMIGAGAVRKRVTTYLTQRIQRYNIPFFTSQMGKGVVDEAMPQYMGTGALSNGDDVHELIAMADCIIAIGYDPAEKPAYFRHSGQKLIHINFFDAWVDDVYAPDLEIIGDIGNTMWQLTSVELDTSLWLFDAVYAHKEELGKTYHTRMKQTIQNKPHDRLGPHEIVQTIYDHYGEKGIVSLDNGLYKLWFARNYIAHTPESLLLDNALATMGAGYSVGCVAKMLYPDRDVVCVVGDGGLMMNVGDIETVVRLGLDMVIVVLRDDGYGMIKRKQDSMGFDTYALSFGNPDVVQLAQSFGARGMRVETPVQFGEKLAHARAQRGLTIIDTPVWYPQEVK